MFIFRYRSWAHMGKSRVQLLPVSRWVPKISKTQITCSCVFPFFRKDAERSNLAKLQKLHFLKAILNHYVHGEIP